MLNLLLGQDWVANQNAILSMIAKDVADERPGRVLIVPELMSHNTERRLCQVAGDTASRFAEVLSFTRMAQRVSELSERAVQDCLDDGGRIVAMAAAVQSVNSRLKAYASVSTRPEFLANMVDAVDEFKRCCIRAEDLSHASKNTTGSLAQKLEELSLILESYDGICLHGKKDPRERMQWLLDELHECSYGEDHTFFVDGFPDFTRQNLAVLEYLIQVSSDVTISLCCDEPNTSTLAFEKVGQTAAELIRIAKRHGVAVNLMPIKPENALMLPVCSKLFQGSFDGQVSCVSLFRAETPHQECIQAARQIQDLVCNGVRYRQIGVVCGDLPAYRNLLQSVFSRANIPVYISGTDSILEKPIISTVLAAINTAMNGFEQKDVLQYLKTSLSPVDDVTCDELENYVIKWGITGSSWLREWTYHPFELGGKWDDKATAAINHLNGVRVSAIEPLQKLRDGLRHANNVAQQVEALYAFFHDISLAEKLDTIAQAYSTEDNRNAQILDQLWEILIGALEQMHAVLGSCIWESEVFSRLFRLLLSQYSVGTIPASLDCVTVGSVSTMRCQQVKHLFVLGALEGSFPAFSGINGVLTDGERTKLRTMGLPLTGGAMDGLRIEFFEIYSAFCGATESVSVSCPSGQPSFVYQRLKNIAGCVEREAENGILNAREAAAYFARSDRSDLAGKLSVAQEYTEIQNKRNHTLGRLSSAAIEKLYGRKLSLSASKVDMQAKCRFSYLLKYGLRLEERKSITIDPAEYGTYVHDVLERTVAEVMELGGFSKVSQADTLKIAKVHAQNYANSYFSDFDTERVNYLFNRNYHELEYVVKDLWEELHISEFLPRFMELGFDVGEAMPPIEIRGQKMDAFLRGYVDRVDVWENDGKQYFRVVDYKTGKKTFDYCDIANGIGLQMLLYLFALEYNGKHLIGDHAVPAGVQYFPARSPFIALKGTPDEKTVAKARKDVLKRKGLILADENVICAMEPLDTPERLSYTRTKEGSITGDAASSRDFQQLKDYVFDLLCGAVNEIASGVITPNPYYRDQFDNACAYCPYSSICHKDNVEDFRCYKSISSEEFWNTIRKEHENHGRTTDTPAKTSGL